MGDAAGVVEVSEESDRLGDVLGAAGDHRSHRGRDVELEIAVFELASHRPSHDLSRDHDSPCVSVTSASSPSPPSSAMTRIDAWSGAPQTFVSGTGDEGL